jgi:molybdopterin/thiamine biosynthesis adenylyltransferase
VSRAASLPRLLARLAPTDDRATYRPTIFDLANEGDARLVDALLDAHPETVVHDSLREQLVEVITSQSPTRDLDEREREAALEARLGGRPLALYGRWVYYPWARRLVHALPPEEHFFLRSDRNRYKISFAEQERLRGATVGVVGLSVGQASAVTLAMEGVGGRFRLADFDTLSLSNMNRLRAGLADVGVPKTVLAAREMYEIDPYLSVEIFSDGITAENAEAFFTEGGKLDLLVEECDDLYAKLSLRERARAYRIPVLMETSDRGMVDVERFDREPERPILHGLVGDLRAEALVGLTTKEKVPYVLRILDEKRISTAFAASLVEVKESTVTWPQLASGIALGGALVTDTARRMLLGRFQGSGRFYVDLEELVADGAAVSLAPVADAGEPPPGSAPVAAPALPARAEGAALTAEEARYLVAHAVLAPSGGNTQPWRFEVRGDTCLCFLDERRIGTFLDYGDAASRLAVGAAVENLVLAAATLGLNAAVEAVADPSAPRLVARITFTRSPHRADPSTLAVVRERVTNRRFGERRPLDPADAAGLLAAAEEAGLTLRIAHDPAAMARVAEVLGRCDRMRFLSQPMHRDLVSEVRWSAEAARSTRTGIDLPSLELSPSDEAAMRILSQWRTMDCVRSFGGGKALERPAQKVLAASSAVALLTIPRLGDGAYLQGGRGLQRVWLAATGRRLAFQPYSSLLYLLARNERGEGVGLDERERATLRELRAELSLVFPRLERHTELLLFRVSYAGEPSSRALRLAVDDVLTYAPR